MLHVARSHFCHENLEIQMLILVSSFLHVDNKLQVLKAGLWANQHAFVKCPFCNLWPTSLCKIKKVQMQVSPVQNLSLHKSSVFHTIQASGKVAL